MKRKAWTMRAAGWILLVAMILTGFGCISSRSDVTYGPKGPAVSRSNTPAGSQATRLPQARLQATSSERTTSRPSPFSSHRASTRSGWSASAAIRSPRAGLSVWIPSASANVGSRNASRCHESGKLTLRSHGSDRIVIVCRIGTKALLTAAANGTRTFSVSEAVIVMSAWPSGPWKRSLIWRVS